MGRQFGSANSLVLRGFCSLSTQSDCSLSGLTANELQQCNLFRVVIIANILYDTVNDTEVHLILSKLLIKPP